MSSIVLLSGGLDSTVSLSQALREGEVKLCITFNYGQRAALKEIEAAENIAAFYKLKHKTIRLPFLEEITDTSLVNIKSDVPEPSLEELEQQDKIIESTKNVWVPNRNGLFINIAAAFAEAINSSRVITGFNLEEAKAFPDNSREFLISCNKALMFSTL
ncbi:MAG: 7-cyano-7-deazaguanine synthase, partial [Peptococcaceae bacterium]|nr:7-cyano-7-deazaguanine synthase [Peptococcaceae bacterium]